MQSPLKFSTPSPKLSERVTSPVGNAKNVASSTILSPSKGVGIGSTWSAALEEQLNRPRTDSSDQSATSKEMVKENIFGSQSPKTESRKSGPLSKPTRIVLEREILSPELVIFPITCIFFLYKCLFVL